MANKTTYDTIWISWHLSRRSITLSDCLGIPLMAVQYEGSALSRHVKSASWSIKQLVRLRPRTLFLQYSFLLLVIVSVYKALTPYRVTVYCDCHTKALRREVHGWGKIIFSILKKWSIGTTDVVILSNTGQVKDLERFSDNFLIVPDFIPVFGEENNREVAFPYCVISMSFDRDEPVVELAEAAELIAKNQDVYITGPAPYWYRQRFANNPRVHITGFIEDDKYLKLIRSANCIASLTNEEGCLQCTGYEAIAFEVPFITSDTIALRDYFGGSAIFVKHSAASIAKGVEVAYQRNELYRRAMAELKRRKQLAQFDNVRLLKNLLP